ncbi:hypothetical protein EXE48_11945 [Halorubrum sp. ASP1]|uniref:hypothetical protein n=1 Tax=Halorubrum sp. ASP1 TaxID=2518114 RepID=UPI0010F9437E|nr:hypothetical protein [Halorubrum sp. ASP1]TKX60678.1 hypothetical protein EXE48_11945 [Halorubrum sp. ASP1]
MGAHLKFKLEDSSNALEANQWISEQEEDTRLAELEHAQAIRFVEEEREFGSNVGEGDVKPSSIHDNKAEVLELWAALFDKLHDHDSFNIRVLASSCALRLMTFSLDQLQRITNRGRALSGPRSGEYRDMLQKSEIADQYNTLAEQFGKDAVPECLDYFLHHFDVEVTPEGLTEDSPFRLTTVVNAIETLAEIGVVEKTQSGLYCLDDAHPATEPFLEAYRELAMEIGPHPFSSIFSSQTNAAVLNCLLVYHTETFRMDMLTEMLPVSDSEVYLACSGLEDTNVVTSSYDSFWSLNAQNAGVESLLEAHRHLILPTN